MHRDQESAEARKLQIGRTLLALLLGVLSEVIITRQITWPLRQTLEVVERIASGDLSQTVLVTRQDELGVLQQGIQRMGATLRNWKRKAPRSARSWMSSKRSPSRPICWP